MKIAILGIGNIGKTLVRELTRAGHEITIANSRGPDTIDPSILASGASATTAQDAVTDVDVIILSIPFERLSTVKPILAGVPDETVVIDTANYYPARDGAIDAIEAGQVESLWVIGQLGRPVAKAWNAIGARSFAEYGKARAALAVSPFRLPPIAPSIETWQCDWSMKPASTRSTRAQSRAPGVSSPDRPSIAPTSKRKRWQQRTTQPTKRAFPSVGSVSLRAEPTRTPVT
ncbi:NAD(P)-binding domain-containing protein [Sphingobium sp. AN558]|uniref:NADPH-dependent F420 reductase n=1 Tax=Sphingobium sp. AN558 TaxID=3133442 RepID=UPI0030C4F018